jgi:hypothetical protein
MHYEGRALTTVGRYGYRVAVESRANGTLRASWYQAGIKKRVALPDLLLVDGDEIRNQLTVQRAEEIALRISHALARGDDPVRQIPEPEVGPAMRPSSLGAVANRYFSEEVGAVVSADTITNYRKFRADCERILGTTFDLNDLSIETVSTLSRALAHDFAQQHAKRIDQATLDLRKLEVWKKTKKRKNAKKPKVTKRPPAQIPGLIATQKCVQWIYTIARWGFDRRIVDRLPAIPRGWKGIVKGIWERFTGQRPTVDRPAYNEADVRRFFAVLRRIDPRIALLLEVALGSRLGQACRITRKSLDLSADHVGAGKLTIPGGGEKKPGMVIDLSRRAVRAIRRAFATYLAIFEGAYQTGEIADYWLVPGGPLDDLKTPAALRNADCISEQFLGNLFDEAETTAGVEKRRKRRMHGLRRFVRTRGARLEPDTRVLDGLIGHDSRGVGGLYEDEEDPWVRSRILEVREEIVRIVSHPASKEK